MLSFVDIRFHHLKNFKKVLENLSFVCVGPQRTATSWLQEVLSHHPEICLPRGVKETMFFDKRYSKGIEWYRWHFEHLKPDQIAGEIAPTYFHSIDAVERIHKFSPNAKIIILIRNPLQRCYSLYRHHLSKGRIRIPFEEALIQFPELTESGRYSRHAVRWEEKFSQEQVYYFWQEDISERPELVISDFCANNHISNIILPEVTFEKVNSATAPRSLLVARIFSATSTALRSMRLYSLVDLAKLAGLKSAFTGGAKLPPITLDTHQRLIEIFRPEIEWLESRFNKNLDDYRKY
jgi:hypothetical protein